MERREMVLTTAQISRWKRRSAAKMIGLAIMLAVVGALVAWALLKKLS